jgi:hypothetical protein
MKKILFAILIGLLAGAGTTVLIMRHYQAAPEAAAADAAPTEEEEDEGLILTKEEQKTAGLATAQPEPYDYKLELKAFGRVLDSSSLAAGLTDIEAARAALDASAKEYERVKMLKASDNASAKALETAEAAKRRDQSTLEAAEGKLLSTWGKALVGRENLAALAQAVLKQDAALARVDLFAGEVPPTAPLHFQVHPLAGNDEFHDAQFIGPAPSTDPQAQGAAYLVLLPAPVPPPGAALLARVTGDEPPQAGLRVPRSALVLNDGAPFVYLQTGDEGFDRRKVELGPPIADGVFIPNGLTPKDRVVVKGAQQLLSKELSKANGG